MAEQRLADNRIARHFQPGGDHQERQDRQDTDQLHLVSSPFAAQDNLGKAVPDTNPAFKGRLMDRTMAAREILPSEQGAERRDTRRRSRGRLSDALEPRR